MHPERIFHMCAVFSKHIFLLFFIKINGQVTIYRHSTITCGFCKVNNPHTHIWSLRMFCPFHHNVIYLRLLNSCVHIVATLLISTYDHSSLSGLCCWSSTWLLTLNWFRRKHYFVGSFHIRDKFETLVDKLVFLDIIKD